MEPYDADDQFFQAFKAGVDAALDGQDTYEVYVLTDAELWAAYQKWVNDEQMD